MLQADDTTIYYTRTSIAAAQVAGALALMIDYNRQHDLGYDNNAFSVHKDKCARQTGTVAGLEVALKILEEA